MAKNNSDITVNRKAYHDYFVQESLEAGIALCGSEVKSLRAGQVNLKDSFVKVMGGEAWLVGAHISPYEKGSYFNLDPDRSRKLLLKRKEIDKLFGQAAQKGYTVIPLKMYFKNALVKVEIGLCKGKELHDKRRSQMEKDVSRSLERAKKEYNIR